jgi:hypothetical protein
VPIITALLGTCPALATAGLDAAMTHIFESTIVVTESERKVRAGIALHLQATSEVSTQYVKPHQAGGRDVSSYRRFAAERLGD